jgi:hypothetical protein
MFENAAGERQLRNPLGAIVGCVPSQALNDEMRKVSQLFCFAVENILRNGVSF